MNTQRQQFINLRRNKYYTMRKTYSILLLILLLSVSACSTEPDIKELLNTLWKLESFENDGKTIIPPKDQTYNIQFHEDNTLNGKSDCNEMNGVFNLKSNYITIGSLATTEMYCGDTSLGGMYVEALQKSKSYKVDKNKLSIYYGTNSKLIFIGE